MRSWRAPRGNVGVQTYDPAAVLVDGIPQPWVCVSPTSGSTTTGLAEVDAFDAAVGLKTNCVNIYVQLYSGWPSGVPAVAASGRHQIFTLEPYTGYVAISGGVRASDGVTDTPLVADRQYVAVVTAGSPTLALNVTQPVGTYVTVNNHGLRPARVLGTALTSSTPSGTVLDLSTFTAVGPSTIIYLADLAGVVGGSYESKIRQWARFAAGNKVIIRFAHEMNGDWYPWCVAPTGLNSGFTAAQWRALWAYARGVWRDEETDNNYPEHCAWIWAPNGTNNESGLLSDVAVMKTAPGVGSQFPLYPPATPGAVGTGDCVYPGDDGCEAIGIDTYAYHGTYAGNYPTFERLFGTNLTYVGQHFSLTKPLHVSETACGENFGTANRAGWIRDMFAYMAEHPRVTGLNWFDHGTQNANSGGYAIDDDPRACTAYLAGLQGWAQPYLAAG